MKVATLLSLTGTLFSLIVTGAFAHAAPVAVTLLHTNDLHSHFRSDKSVLNLGGVARLKTAIDRARKAASSSFLVDGGDWSEGNIYYTLGAGVESLRMMDDLGYDVAVVGNHDWLNGPDTLLDSINAAQTHMALVSANLNVEHYSRAKEIREKVLPYIVREVSGVKIAFIGLSTFDKLYAGYFKPISILNPENGLEYLARTLKKSVDAVVVISHNSTKNNIKYLKNSPSVDLIVGAHDHTRLTEPVVVDRGGSKAWIVEAGCWGMYLGKVEMNITPKNELLDGQRAVELKSYALQQIDERLPEDPAILKRIQNLEDKIGSRMGSIFSDKIGESEVEISSDGHGPETMIGNLVTDAYRDRTQADAALDQVGMIYGELHPGKIKSVDVFNADPGVYNPNTGKSWTLHEITMAGWKLNLLINTVFNDERLADIVSLASSGLTVLYDPFFYSSLKDPLVTIQDQPIQPDQTYRIAVGGGIVESFKFMDHYIPGIINLKNLTDLGVEDWRVVADYIHAKSPITLDTVSVTGRYQTRAPDLAVFENNISWKPHFSRGNKSAQVEVKVMVRNLGTEATESSSMQLLANANGADYAKTERMVALSASQGIPALKPGEGTTLTFHVSLYADRGIFGITARVAPAPGEKNLLNNEATRWFRATRR